MDEFDLINRYLVPLSNGDERARGLKDDIAFMAPHNLLVTKDILQAGVHFHVTDPLNGVAQKALRVNLSDIYCKGGRPFGYFLGLMIPDDMPQLAIRSLCDGLKSDQAAFGLSLLGGDTIASKGPLTLSITMLAYSPKIPPSRAGARPGDLVYVTGSIGDSWLGLACHRAAHSAANVEAHSAKHDPDANPSPDIGLNSLTSAHQNFVMDRYLCPEPRAAFSTSNLYEEVTASIDISDGLIADAGHIALASGVSIDLDLAALPLSDAARAYLAVASSRETALVNLATGGDDYEILYTIAPADQAYFDAKSGAAGLKITRIGHCVSVPAGDHGQVLARHGQDEVRLSAMSGGYRHIYRPDPSS